MEIVQVDAPTLSHSEEEVEDLYENTEKIFDNGKHYYQNSDRELEWKSKI